MRRNVGPVGLVFDWLAAHPDSVKWDRMLAWLVAVATDPDLVTSGGFTNGRREVRFSHVPGADTRVSFVVLGPPVPAIHLIEISDDKYQPRDPG